jgi:hypothetical protein
MSLHSQKRSTNKLASNNSLERNDLRLEMVNWLKTKGMHRFVCLLKLKDILNLAKCLPIGQ